VLLAILALAILAFTIVAVELTDMFPNIPFDPWTIFNAVTLPADTLPVTVTLPKVVVPEPPDCANIIQELAVVVPSPPEPSPVSSPFPFPLLAGCLFPSLP
jgi:hypothetical protein